MAEREPLNVLAPAGAASAGSKDKQHGKSFIAGMFITFVILWLAKPNWLMKLDADGHVSQNIDWWTMLLSCLVGGFIIMLGYSMR